MRKLRIFTIHLKWIVTRIFRRGQWVEMAFGTYHTLLIAWSNSSFSTVWLLGPNGADGFGFDAWFSKKLDFITKWTFILYRFFFLNFLLLRFACGPSGGDLSATGGCVEGSWLQICLFEGLWRDYCFIYVCVILENRREDAFVTNWHQFEQNKIVGSMCRSS